MTMETIQAFFADAVTWIKGTLWSLDSALQIALIAFGILAAIWLGHWVKRGLDAACRDIPAYHKFAHFVTPLYAPSLLLILLGTSALVLDGVDRPVFLIGILNSLLVAWIVIRMMAMFIANRDVARMVAALAWTVAALNIVGLLDPLMEVLDGADFAVGNARLSILAIIKGMLAFGLLIWSAFFMSRLIEARLRASELVTPSARVLISKTAKIVLVTLAFLIALNATGIDLTVFAVFGGALGVGIGFGLQKVVSNFISGIILLIDRSIKPGDVIEIEGTYGTINKLAARYTSVMTRDGTEYLIPNEDMITQPVVNWSHSHRLVRRRIPINVAYSTDLRFVEKLMNEVAEEHDRILRDPAPKTLLKGFGDNGVDMELRLWIRDPQNGVSNIASEIMFAIWDKFQANGIEFPFPQRVIHITRDQASAILKDGDGDEGGDGEEHGDRDDAP